MKRIDLGMKISFDLFFNSFDDFRIAVAYIQNADTGNPVHNYVAVQVLHHASLGFVYGVGGLAGL
jgi:hypothetical protein